MLEVGAKVTSMVHVSPCPSVEQAVESANSLFVLFTSATDEMTRSEVPVFFMVMVFLGGGEDQQVRPTAFTEPFPLPSFINVRAYYCPENTALTVRFLSMVTTQSPVPGQSLAGAQPRKVEPVSAEADRVTS